MNTDNTLPDVYEYRTSVQHKHRTELFHKLVSSLPQL